MTDLTAEAILAAIDRALERVSVRVAKKDEDGQLERNATHPSRRTRTRNRGKTPTKRKISALSP